jgi:glutaminyl-tRNA synthetase
LKRVYSKPIRKFCDIIGVAKRENIIDFSLFEFCLREDLNKTVSKSYGGFRSNKISNTNYPEDKEEWLEAENNREDAIEKHLFSENYLLKEKTFRRCPKVFRLSLGREAS